MISVELRGISARVRARERINFYEDEGKYDDGLEENRNQQSL